MWLTLGATLYATWHGAHILGIEFAQSSSGWYWKRSGVNTSSCGTDPGRRYPVLPMMSSRVRAEERELLRYMESSRQAGECQFSNLRRLPWGDNRIRDAFRVGSKTESSHGSAGGEIVRGARRCTGLRKLCYLLVRAERGGTNPQRARSSLPRR